MTLRTSSGVTAGPSASRTWLWTHCQTCERAISAVAASSIRLKMPTAAVPRSHEDRYWMATLTSLRRPSSVASAGDERGHAADRRRLAPVAGLDQQLGVGAHERYGHGDLVAVGQGELGPVPELLDYREHVVPAAGVQPGRVVAQLVEDLVHLEGGGDGLDQHGCLDGAARDAEAVLGQLES